MELLNLATDGTSELSYSGPCPWPSSRVHFPQMDLQCFKAYGTLVYVSKKEYGIPDTQDGELVGKMMIT